MILLIARLRNITDAAEELEFLYCRFADRESYCEIGVWGAVTPERREGEAKGTCIQYSRTCNCEQLSMVSLMWAQREATCPGTREL